MNKIFKLAALLSVCLAAFAGCSPDELSTDQFSDESVTFAAFAPNPVARGGALRITGSNLQKVSEVILPGIEPITEIEVVKEGKISEIRVIVPVDGPEVGTISVVADGKTYTSMAELTYSEPIIFESFKTDKTPAMPGDIVTIKGDYMNNIKAVQFEGGETVTVFESQSRYELKVAIPSTAYTGKIILCDVDENNNPDGLVANLFYSEEDLVIGQPVVNSANRGELKSGAEITVKGEYLNMIQKAVFRVPAEGEGAPVDTESAFVLAEDNKSVKTTLPATVADGELVLVSYAGDEFKAGAYTTLVPSDLAIAAETRYKAGLKAVVTGKDLDLVTGASLAGTALSPVLADGKITFEIPATAVDGTVTLTLANGKTVETEAIELVKPVITAMSPLELYAGDEPVVVTGEDLDLVASASLGGVSETIEVAEDGKSIKVGTTVSSVSGKIVLTLANGVAVESLDEVKVNYHSLVIVTEMPSAQHIGMEVVLKGSKFDLVENIFIGDEKVTSYSLRTPEEVRFLMPWNKVGSYKIQFHLFNGDVETLATPIEVLLELQMTTIWEGSFNNAGWSGNQDLAWGGYDWTTVKPGDVLQIHGTPNDPAADWWCVSLRVGDGWANLNGVPGQYDNPTVIQVELTQEIIDHLISGNGLVVTGDGYTMTKIEIVREISQEVTVWEGPQDLGAWSINLEIKPNDMFVTNPVTAGQKLRFYVTPTSDWWQLQLFNGHWGGLVLPESSAGNNNVNAGDTTISADGYIEITVTELMVEEFTTMIDWGYAMIVQGENLILNKIALF